MLTRVELRRVNENPKPRGAGEDTVDLSIQPVVDARFCREFETKHRPASKRRTLTAQALNALAILQERGHAAKR